MNKNQMNASETILCVLTLGALSLFRLSMSNSYKTPPMSPTFESKLHDELLKLAMLRRERMKFDAKKKRKTKGR